MGSDRNVQGDWYLGKLDANGDLDVSVRPFEAAIVEVKLCADADEGDVIVTCACGLARPAHVEHGYRKDPARCPCPTCTGDPDEPCPCPCCGPDCVPA